MWSAGTSIVAILTITILPALFFIALIQLIRLQNAAAKPNKARRRIHLLVVLGSGGHTEEMLSMMRYAGLNPGNYSKRTYIVSAGDSFSARKAIEFEKSISNNAAKEGRTTASTSKNRSNTADFRTEYSIITIPRARRVHQSFLTAPFSTLQCLWACLLVLQGKHFGQKQSTEPRPQTPQYPDLILTNGPGIAVCVIVAARLLRFLNWVVSYNPRNSKKTEKLRRGKNRGYLRTIFIESWARVTTLSLSGRLVLPMVDRFLVQWEPLEGYSSWNGNKTEYVGPLLS